jgi:hypothetical protein
MRVTGLSRSRSGPTVTPIAAMRAPLGRRRPAVDQDPGRMDAVAEHGVVDGEQITRRRLHLSRRRAWATVGPAGTGSERPSRATGMAEPCSSSPQQQPCARGQPQLGGPGRRCRHGPGRRVWLLILGRAGGACSQRPHDRGWGNQPLPTTNGTYRQIHHPRDGNMERCVSAPHGSPGPWRRHR